MLNQEDVKSPDDNEFFQLGEGLEFLMVEITLDVQK